MISCTEAEFMISQLVDLELGSRQEHKLKLHVESCSRCRAQMKDDEDTTHLLSQTLTPDPELLSPLQSAILMQVDETPVVRDAVWYGRLPLMAAASLVFGFAVWVGVASLMDAPPASFLRPTVVDVPSATPSLAPRPVLFLRQNFQQVEPFDNRGDAPLGVRTLRKRTIVTDAPESIEAGRDEVRLEFEKVDKTFFKFVDDPWQ
jgi:hypothetical protein